MSEVLHVLLVEDSEDDARLLMRKLQQSGYAPVFERVKAADAFSAQLEEKNWDIVLSDYALPAFTALDALRLLKEKDLDLPFIIVSGAIGEETAVAAMKAGAHDYVMKDNLARLIPAIERELREVGGRRMRRQAEEALRESERKNRRLSREFCTLLDNIPDALILLDADRKAIWANSGTAAMLGRPLEDLTEGQCRKLWPECSARDENCAVRRCFQSGHPEVGLVRTAGGKTWGVRAFPVLNKKGRVANVIKIVSDNSHQLLLKEEANRAAHLQQMLSRFHLKKQAGGTLRLAALAKKPAAKKEVPALEWPEQAPSKPKAVVGAPRDIIALDDTEFGKY